MSLQVRPPDPDEVEFCNLVEGLARREVTIKALLPIAHVVILIGQIQLAQRHPHNRDEAAMLARKLCDGLIEAVGFHSPRLAELLAYGDDPTKDKEVLPAGHDN